MSNYETVDLDRFSAVFRALSNPHRLKIYTILSGCCTPGTLCDTNEMLTCCVGDLDGQLDIAPSTLSHHLRELKQAGLVNMQRQGKQVLCSLNPDRLEEIRQLFGHGQTAIQQ